MTDAPPWTFSGETPAILPSAVFANNWVYITAYNGFNYYIISGITAGIGGNGYPNGTGSSITVQQAYAIDTKVDDGIATTGKVQAWYTAGSGGSQVWSTSGNPDSTSTCYNSSTDTYSMSQSSGANPNCALAIQMQGAAR